MEPVQQIIEILKERYPDAVCALGYAKDYQLMIAVRLSAQCTDARVNLVTPALFERFPTLESFAEATPEEVEPYVRSCGFYKHKARDIVLACRMLRDEYGGKVPDTMQELLRIPGVGRKTANLLLGDLYGQPAVVCDTHCIRIANRLGLAHGKEPEKVEQQLRAILPRISAIASCCSGAIPVPRGILPAAIAPCARSARSSTGSKERNSEPLRRARVFFQLSLRVRP